MKHGSRGTRGWKKLHLGVDETGMIVAHALTGGHVDDATTALDLIDTVEGDVSCLTADAAYDTRGIYEAVGRRQWKKDSGYHRQARVENAVFRYKSVIGDRLRARHPRAQETEAAIACNILNRMTELGRPASFATGP